MDGKHIPSTGLQGDNVNRGAKTYCGAEQGAARAGLAWQLLFDLLTLKYH